MTSTTSETSGTAPPIDRWADTGPHPWRRFLARTFDNAVIGGALWFLIGYGTYVISFEAGEGLLAFTASIYWRLLHSTMVLASMIPVQAAMISLTGASPGKWLCGIRVRNHDGTRLGLGTAMMRELKVWLIGYAAGLPLIYLFALIQAYNRVKDSGTADWDDANDTVVASLPITGTRAVLVALAIMVTLLITAWGIIERFPEFGR